MLLNTKLSPSLKSIKINMSRSSLKRESKRELNTIPSRSKTKISTTSLKRDFKRKLNAEPSWGETTLSTTSLMISSKRELNTGNCEENCPLASRRNITRACSISACYSTARQLVSSIDSSKHRCQPACHLTKSPIPVNQ